MFFSDAKKMFIYDIMNNFFYKCSQSISKQLLLLSNKFSSRLKVLWLLIYQKKKQFFNLKIIFFVAICECSYRYTIALLHFSFRFLSKKNKHISLGMKIAYNIYMRNQGEKKWKGKLKIEKFMISWVCVEIKNFELNNRDFLCVGLKEFLWVHGWTFLESYQSLLEEFPSNSTLNHLSSTYIAQRKSLPAH